MKIYDVAFIGMGASALATAKLNYAGTSHSLIGIDKEYHNKRNNFFAFWMTDWMENFSNLTQKKWFNWEFYLAMNVYCMKLKIYHIAQYGFKIGKNIV